MGHLTIIRGLPGSGKTTLARKLASENGCMHINPDMLMMHDGVYRYTPSKHMQALRDIKTIICQAGHRGADLIVSDVLPAADDILPLIGVYYSAHRVNPSLRDYTHPSCTIIDLAISLDASFCVNTHKVPIEDIEAMQRAWESEEDIKELSKFKNLEIRHYPAPSLEGKLRECFKNCGKKKEPKK